MFLYKENEISKYIYSIFKKESIKKKLFKEITSDVWKNRNKNKKGYFINKIHNFQKSNINQKNDIFKNIFKEKSTVHLLFLNYIKKFKKYKRMEFKIESKIVKKNRSVDILLKDKLNDKSKKFVFFFRIHHNIKNSLKVNDKDNLFKELIFILFELYLKIIFSSNITNSSKLLRRKSFEKKTNSKEIKLSTLNFEDFIYDLIIKLQLKNINNNNYNDIYIPKFLKNIKSFKRDNCSKYSILETNKFKIINIILNMNKNLNLKKNLILDNNIFLKNELNIYNILVKFIKSYYNIDDFILKTKKIEDININKVSNKDVNDLKNEIPSIFKNNLKNKNIKKIRDINKIDLIYSKSKNFKIKSFDKILKSKKSKELLYSSKKFNIMKITDTSNKNVIKSQKKFKKLRYKNKFYSSLKKRLKYK